MQSPYNYSAGSANYRTKFTRLLTIFFLGSTILSFSQSDLDSDNDGILDSTECGFAACAEPIVNGGFEQPDFPNTFNFVHENNLPGWETTAADGIIEIWPDGLQGISAAEGDQFAELNANVVSTLFQRLCLTPGTEVRWSVQHRGRNGIDVANVKIGRDLASATVQAVMSDGRNAWGTYTGTYLVPMDQTETIFAFESVSSTGGNSIGNFIDNVQITVLSTPPCLDSDGDGIPNNQDLDSDNDGCNDVIEAGFTDGDGDGVLGTGTPTEDSNGVVTSGTDGYTTPADADNNGVPDYLEVTPDAVFTTNLTNASVVEGNAASFSFSSNISAIAIQWEESTDGGANWTAISDNTIYSGTSTTTLTISNPSLTFNTNQYRVSIRPLANVCKTPIISNAILNVIPLNPIEIPDGFSPNGDGINDTFVIKNLAPYTNHVIEIYNRHGYLVYRGINSSTPWDGKSMSGKELPEGVYFYVLKLNQQGVTNLQGRIHLRK